MSTALLLIGGLCLLVAGGELLVRGAVGVAERLGISPLLIGLTLVGFGTSTPELVTSVQAALEGHGGIAVGNIVGSNIANVLLILGISALLSPIAVGSLALRRDGLIGLAAALALLAIAWTAALDRIVGTALLLALIGYLVLAWRTEQRADQGHTAAFDHAEALVEVHPELGAAHPARAGRGALVRDLAMALGGLVVVVVGGRLLVDGAVELGRTLGVSETVIGLTVVAVGTSLPELVTSLIAAVRGHAEVAFGNVLGSNIYNILGIGGVTALIAPTAIPVEIARLDAPVMTAAAIVLVVFARTGWRIGRREGSVLLAGYAGYIAVLVAVA